MAEFLSSTTIRVECPFFISPTPQYITCESAFCEGGVSKHRFPNAKEKDIFLAKNCCKDRGEGCVYYNAIMLRYEQE